jgi:hypothetical protein
MMKALEVEISETEKSETVSNSEVFSATEELNNEDIKEPILDAESLFKTSDSNEKD